MREFVLPVVFLTMFAVVGVAQHPTGLDYGAFEKQKRSFEELGPIMIDVDGDGKNDRIQPRTYQTYKHRRKPLRKRDILNWITFDLFTSRGIKARSFFTYNYGTAEEGGSYWIYVLTSTGDTNKDGKTDLVFYSGDDTSDETIKLANLGMRFKVISRKKTESGDWVEQE